MLWMPVGAGSLPNSLQGLPMDTGLAKSAVAVRVTVVVGIPRTPAKKLGTWVDTVTSSWLGLAPTAGVTVVVALAGNPSIDEMDRAVGTPS